MKYTVRGTRCACHRDTCSCSPFEVIDPTGNKFVGVYDYDKAEKIAKALTHFEQHQGHAYQKTFTKA